MLASGKPPLDDDPQPEQENMVQLNLFERTDNQSKKVILDDDHQFWDASALLPQG